MQAEESPLYFALRLLGERVALAEALPEEAVVDLHSEDVEELDEVHFCLKLPFLF